MASYLQGTSAVDASRAPKLEITYKPIEHLRLAADNPRKHPKKQIKQIAASIRAFGFRFPILVDSEDTVICGHGRVLAAKQLGMLEVPAIGATDLSQPQIQALRITDNKLNENSEWDERLLADSLKNLCEVNLDFDIEVTGFSTGEIDCKILGLSAPISGEDPADEIPADQNAIRVSKPGDLWLLGEHRLLCADARLPESYTKLMVDLQAATIFTDVPFNLRVTGHVSGKGVIRHDEFPMASGEMTEEQYTNFLVVVSDLMAQNSCDGAIAFVCIDRRHVAQMIDAGKRSFSELKNVCVWAKDRAGMGTFYRSQQEFVCVFKKGTAAHTNNFELGQHGRYRSNLWSYPCPIAFGRSREEGDLLALHPTVKPVAMIADAIIDVSKRKDVVLDPFLGSGTTVIASERTGRICFAMELDPQYVDLSIRRWQAFTGLTALHAASSRSFHQIEKEATDVAQ